MIVGISKDNAQIGVACNKNCEVLTKGLVASKFDIFAFKITVNVSAILIVLSNQLINIEVGLNERKFVLPPSDPVTDIEYSMSLALQIDSIEDTVN